MPNPWLYVQSLGIAALVSAVCVFVIAGRGGVSPARLNAACIASTVFGIIAGCWLLKWRWIWPPASALDRVLTLILPAALIVELVAGSTKFGAVLARPLRTVLIVSSPFVLLYGSVHLPNSIREFSLGNLSGAWSCVACSALLVILWIALLRLSRRSETGLSIAFVLCLVILGTGTAIMLGGYLKGGAIAFVFAGTLSGVAIASQTRSPRLSSAVVTAGVFALAGVVGTGYFFGRLPLPSAIGLLLAPLLCGVSLVPWFQKWSALGIGTLRLLLVSVVLFAILLERKQEFDRKFAPLLGPPSSSSQRLDR